MFGWVLREWIQYVSSVCFFACTEPKNTSQPNINNCGADLIKISEFISIIKWISLKNKLISLVTRAETFRLKISTNPVCRFFCVSTNGRYGCFALWKEANSYNRHNVSLSFYQDVDKYLSYENFPVLCRDASAILLPPKEENKPQKSYVCKQVFDCCRNCNHVFYTCLKLPDTTYGFCMRGAYKCMCDCIDNKSFQELPYKPTPAS